MGLDRPGHLAYLTIEDYRAMHSDIRVTGGPGLRKGLRLIKLMRLQSTYSPAWESQNKVRLWLFSSDLARAPISLISLLNDTGAHWPAHSAGSAHCSEQLSDDISLHLVQFDRQPSSTALICSAAPPKSTRNRMIRIMLRLLLSTSSESPCIRATSESSAACCQCSLSGRPMPSRRCSLHSAFSLLLQCRVAIQTSYCSASTAT